MTVFAVGEIAAILYGRKVNLPRSESCAGAVGEEFPHIFRYIYYNRPAGKFTSDF